MSIEMAQYIEVNAVGICLLFTMWAYNKWLSQTERGNKQKYFMGMTMCNIIILLADSVIYLFRYHTSIQAVVVSHIACVTYFVLQVVLGYMWFMYSISKLFPNHQFLRTTRSLFCIPVWISFVMAAASPWTQWFYILTEENRYMRGRFIWVDVVLAVIYWLAVVSIVISEMIQNTRMREKSLYVLLLVFPLPTVIGNVLQFMFYGMSITWICSALSIFVLFINLQNNQIARDTLTGLYNRRQMKKQFSWEIGKLPNANNLLYCMMIDVDRFKQINDKYGHIAGDEALKMVAKLLRICIPERDFIARFGGDEFIVIGHVTNESEIQELVEQIKQKEKEYSKDVPYKITLSVGYIMYSSKDTITVDDILSAADEKMYQVKRARQ